MVLCYMVPSSKLDSTIKDTDETTQICDRTHLICSLLFFTAMVPPTLNADSKDQIFLFSFRMDCDICRQKKLDEYIVDET